MTDSNQIFFFDLDDTLIKTTQLNEDIVLKNIKTTIENFNIEDKELIKKYYEVYIKDRTNPQNHYKELLSQFNININNKTDNILKIKHFEFLNLELKSYICENVEKVLKLLNKKEINLGIISQGNPKYQIRKFELSKLKKYFNSNLLYFPEKKTSDFYQTIILKFPNYKITIIGDREDNDIIIPKKLGLNVIRILGNSKYSYNKTQNDYLEFKNMKEFYNYIKN